MAEEQVIYNEDSIRSLDWREHIRLRPGMYIGKLGDGSSVDDGIYILLKGYSSIGRASVSKTEGCRFDSYCPCHLKRWLPKARQALAGLCVCSEPLF